MEVCLSDCTKFEIRPIRADDKARLVTGYQRLSDETRTRRFLTPKPRLNSRELRYLTEVDGADHVALVAVPVDEPDVIVAVGRFVRDDEDPEQAEFAIVVGDHYQRRGLGKRLAALLAQEAVGHGVRRFTASTLSDNLPAQRLIEAVAQRLTYLESGAGVRDVVVELAA